MQEPSGLILVVGGDTHFRYLMHRYANLSNHPIIFSGWEEDVLLRAQSDHPAVILLHVDHSGSMGWNVLASLKACDQTGCIPVVICSWVDDELECQRSGGKVFLRMPILYTDFVTALEKVGIFGNQVIK